MKYFSHILYLWFFLLIPGVVLLHIRQLLRRTVPVPSVILWRTVSEQSGKRRFTSLLKDLISLFLKLALISCAVFSLAGFRTGAGQQIQTVYILDNSLSTSRSIDGTVTPFSRAVEYIRQNMKKGDLLYSTAPRLMDITEKGLPESSSFSECDMPGAVRRIADLHRTADIRVCTDYMPEKESLVFNGSWRSFGKSVPNTGISRILQGNDGVFLSFNVEREKPEHITVILRTDSGQLIEKKLIPEDRSEVFIPLEAPSVYIEAELRGGGGDFNGDDYRCASAGSEYPSAALIAGFNSEFIARYLKAAEIDLIRAKSSVKGSVNFLQDSIPAFKKGQYFLVKPIGVFGPVTFSSVEPVHGKLSIATGSGFAEDLDIADTHCTLTGSAEGVFETLLQVNEKPAAGFFQTADILCVFLLFDPAQEGLLGETPQFPLIMHELYARFREAGIEVTEYPVGNPITRSEDITCFRMGKEMPLASNTADLPGIYRESGKLSFICNAPETITGLSGIEGELNLSSTVRDRQEAVHDRSGLLILVSALLLIILVFIDRK